MTSSAPTPHQPKAFWHWKRASIATVAATVLLGSYTAQMPAIAEMQVAVRQQGWDAVLNVARLTTTNQLVLQLDVLDKPTTSYANAVYRIYARRNGQWSPIFTSTGARLITNAAGRMVLAPEVISLSELQQQLGTADLSGTELKLVTMLRYDVRGGQRDQMVEFEQTQQYSAIAQTTTTQLVSSQISSSQTNTVQARPVLLSESKRDKSRFSLTLLQKQPRLKDVIARISLKPKQGNGFLAEQFVGDFKYKLKEKKQKAKFIRGLNAGDRVVVRLFTTDNRFIGYSEFELLSENTAVTLVLPDRPADYGLIRTVYGLDANEDFSIDGNTRVYDYFTQVTQSTRYQESRVSFLSSVQAFNLNEFNIVGLPMPRPTCTYPASFVTGSFMLVNRVVQVFSSSLATAITALPGQVVQTTDISTTSTSTYGVTQQIGEYRQVGVTQGAVIRSDEDYPAGSQPDKKRHCNQGIGNGAEGCDPGNSHPHGGSNDEGGRTPGGHGKGK